MSDNTNQPLFNGGDFKEPVTSGNKLRNRIENYHLVMGEIDKDYSRQLKHLKQVTQKARRRYLRSHK